MTPSRSVFGRHVDPLQAFRGVCANVCLCAVVWSIGGALLVWAFR